MSQELKQLIKAQEIYNANNVCMTTAECAEFLRVHRRTIDNYIKSGKVKTIRVGWDFRIPKIQFMNEIISEWEKDKTRG